MDSYKIDVEIVQTTVERAWNAVQPTFLRPPRVVEITRFTHSVSSSLCFRIKVVLPGVVWENQTFTLEFSVSEYDAAAAKTEETLWEVFRVAIVNCVTGFKKLLDIPDIYGIELKDKKRVGQIIPPPPGTEELAKPKQSKRRNKKWSWTNEDKG